MANIQIAVILQLCLFLILFNEGLGKKGKKTPRTQQNSCLIFTGTDAWSVSNGGSYVSIGDHDLLERFELTLDVLPDLYEHNGMLFSMGTSGFNYYQWGKDSTPNQFIVVEISYNALSVLLKTAGEEHFYQLEVYKTWPEPYNLTDGNWHKITVKREAHVWFIAVDDVVVHEDVSVKTSLVMNNMPAYIGGRPGYNKKQFRGLLRDVTLNGRRLRYTNAETKGKVDIWPCNSPEVDEFAGSLFVPTTSRPHWNWDDYNKNRQR